MRNGIAAKRVGYYQEITTPKLTVFVNNVVKNSKNITNSVLNVLIISAHNHVQQHITTPIKLKELGDLN